MKKCIIFGGILFLLVIAAMAAYSYLAVPEYARSQPENSETQMIQGYDERVKAALEEGKNYIMEESGLDIPFSTDLLRTVEQYFSTDLEFLGAGLYRGMYVETIALELLLNPAGNVGCIQLSITEQAAESEIKEAVIDFAGFINKNLEAKEKELVAEEALPHLQDLKSKEEYLYYGHDTGFKGKVEDNQLFVCTP